MNLKNFETHIESKILSRGRAYFEHGYISSLEYSDDEWVADVSGSDDYTVTVKLSNNGDVVETYCDCPYDLGAYCKHQVAVFFELRKNNAHSATETKARNTNDKKAPKGESLEDILTKLDKKALISLIIQYSKEYKPIASEIKFRYSEKADKSSDARKLIRSTINAVSDRGFVEYRNVRHAISGANEVLSMIDDMQNSNEYISAVSLAIVVAEEMMDLMNNCDDSNGYVGGAIAEAIEKIQAVIDDVPEEHSDKIFTTVVNHAFNKMYDGWTDWRTDLLSALVPLCGSKKNREQLESYLNDTDSSKSSKWSRDYDLRSMQLIQHDIITRFDGEAAAQDYVNQNLDSIDFRYMAIEHAIKNKQYDKAATLCIEGEKLNQSYPGIVSRLREILFGIHESTGNLH